MKWTRFFLFLILIPGLSYASFNYKECNKMKDNVATEWGKHAALLEKFNKLDLQEKEKQLSLVKEAIMCVQRAIEANENILYKIDHIKEKKERHGTYWSQERREREAFKKSADGEIKTLEAYLNEAPKKFAVEKAKLAWQESVKVVQLGNSKIQNCTRRLNNVEEVVSTLNEAAELFEQGASLATTALQFISPYSDEASEKTLKDSIRSYQMAISECRKEAEIWPTTVATQIAELKKLLIDLQDDRRLFEEKNLKKNSLKTQNQMVPILEQLIQAVSEGEREFFRQELAELKISIASFERQSEKQDIPVVEEVANPVQQVQKEEGQYHQEVEDPL